MYAITLVDIAVAFIPVLVTLVIIFCWSDSFKQASIAMLRMLCQRTKLIDPPVGQYF